MILSNKSKQDTFWSSNKINENYIFFFFEYSIHIPAFLSSTFTSYYTHIYTHLVSCLLPYIFLVVFTLNYFKLCFESFRSVENYYKFFFFFLDQENVCVCMWLMCSRCVLNVHWRSRWEISIIILYFFSFLEIKYKFQKNGGKNLCENEKSLFDALSIMNIEHEHKK